MSNSEILKQKVVVVVGGGNGLGRAIVQACAREGARLVVADLDAQAAEAALASAYGSNGLALGADIADAASGEIIATAAAEAHGRLDVLINCAAICQVDPLLDLSPERWDRVFAVNTRGAFFCMQAAVRRMIPNNFGRIIQISTPASQLGFPNFATYGASKAALDSLVRSAALAWAPHGITVNSLVPGRMTGGMIVDLEKDLAKLSGSEPTNLEEERTKSLPMRRRVAPEEVAEAAVWLASDRAAYVTAERFNFTGGMELQ